MGSRLIAFYVVCVIVMMFGCSNAVQTTENPAMPLNFTTYAVYGDSGTGGQAAAGSFKTFTVRETDMGFSPDTICVEAGDTVGIFVTYTGPDSPQSFSIQGYDAEEFYQSGNQAYLEFTAEKKGVFDFGDDRTDAAKGMLIVS
jgi:plastocyanin